MKQSIESYKALLEKKKQEEASYAMVRYSFLCVIQNLKEKEDKIKSLKEEKALLQKRFSTENSQINVLDALVDCTERYIIPAAIAVYEKIEETYHSHFSDHAQLGVRQVAGTSRLVASGRFLDAQPHSAAGQAASRPRLVELIPRRARCMNRSSIPPVLPCSISDCFSDEGQRSRDALRPHRERSRDALRSGGSRARGAGRGSLLRAGRRAGADLRGAGEGGEREVRGDG